MERIPPPQGINWAKSDLYEGSKLVAERQIGVTEIVTGGFRYTMRRRESELAGVVFRGPVGTGSPGIIGDDPYEDLSRLYLGFPALMPRLRVVARQDHPLALEDPTRINCAAALAIGLFELEAKYNSSLEIIRALHAFETQLRIVEGVASPEFFRSLSILRDELIENTQQNFPAQFHEAADGIERLGLEGIDVSYNGESYPCQYTPDWLRKFQWGQYAKFTLERGLRPPIHKYY